MSLGGPRPALPEEVLGWEDWHRLQIPTRSTGVWQVSGRSEVSFDNRLRMDLFYIENWSLTYDLFILFKTVPAPLGGRWAF